MDSRQCTSLDLEIVAELKDDMAIPQLLNQAAVWVWRRQLTALAFPQVFLEGSQLT